MDDIGNSVAGDGKIKYNFHFLEIPLRINYRISDKKFFSYLTTGLSVNFFLGDKSKSWIHNENGEDVQLKGNSGIRDFNTVRVGIIGGLGLGYRISSKTNLRFEPLFRYSLTPLADAPVKQYNYSIVWTSRYLHRSVSIVITTKKEYL